jgi:hypothetical protein
LLLSRRILKGEELVVDYGQHGYWRMIAPAIMKAQKEYGERVSREETRLVAQLQQLVAKGSICQQQLEEVVSYKPDLGNVALYS